MKRPVTIVLSAFLLATALSGLPSPISHPHPALAASPAVPAPAPTTQIGGVGAGHFGRVDGVATDGSGNLYITDRDNARIQEFTTQGAFVRMWDLGFLPMGVAVANGEVYVVGEQDRGAIFSPGGVLLRTFGDNYAQNGYIAVSVDGSGDIYVVEASHGAVVKFGPDGTQLTGSLTQNGNEALLVYNGSLYVTACRQAGDTGPIVQHYDLNGSLLGSFGSTSQDRCPLGIGADPSGNFHLTDPDHHRIVVLSPSGTLVTQFGSQGQGDGQLYYPIGLSTDAQGNTWVADRDNNRAEGFDASGGFVASIGQPTLYPTNCYQCGYSLPAAAAPDGSLYVLDGLNSDRFPEGFALSHFDAAGKLIGKRLLLDSIPPSLNLVPFAGTGLGLGPDGSLYAAFSGGYGYNALLLKFNPQLQFVTDANPPGGYVSTGQVATDALGFVYVQAGGGAFRFDMNLNLVGSYAISNSLLLDGGLAVDSDGLLYLSGESLFDVFDQAGNLIAAFHAAGNRLAAAPDRSVFSVDAASLQLFNFPSVSAQLALDWSLPSTPIHVAAGVSRIWVSYDIGRHPGAAEAGELDGYGNLFLSRVTPPGGGNTGPLTALLHGRGIQTGASVRLSLSGQPDRVATAVTPSANGTSAGFTVDLTGAALGVWDVTLTNTDGAMATLPAAFTVAEGNAPQVWVDILGRNAVLPGNPETVTVEYGNSGNVDAIGAPIWIGFPSGLTYSTNFQVVPPPPIDTTAPIDWSSVPIGLQENGETIIPLVIPDIPPGFVGSLPVTLTAPANTAPSSYTVRAFVPHTCTFKTPPTSGKSLLDQMDPDLKDCLKNLLLTALSFLGFSLNGNCANILAQFVLNDLVLPYVQLIAGLLANPPKNFNDWLRTITASLEQMLYNILSSQIAFVSLTGPVAACTGTFSAKTLLQSATKFNIYGIIVNIILLEISGQAQALVESCTRAFYNIKYASPPPHFREVTFTYSTVFARDPNDKVGPLGIGSPRYVSRAAPLRYVIYFENEPTATAPAHDVVITDQLDPSLVDFNSFSFGPISFGATQITPPPDEPDFARIVDLRPNQNLLVRIVAHLDLGSGKLTWQFTSLDPSTELPTTDPLAGFLPPDTLAPEGEGSVAYAISPRSGLTTGTTIGNQAVVTFDANAGIATPTWLNTIDAAPPLSHVNPLPATEPNGQFTVSWSGTDDASGIEGFDLLVSDDGGPWSVWLLDSHDTSATYPGSAGHTYGFVSRALDQVGNVEPFHGSADTTTTVLTTTPTTTTLSSSINPSVYGQPVTFTAAVTPIPNGGTVQFSVDGTAFGTPVSVDSTTGKAVSPTDSTLPVGMHTIGAAYSGDASFLSSTAPTLTQTVNRADSSTTLSTSTSPPMFGQPVRFSATVAAEPPGAGTPGGTVQFAIDGKPFGDPVALSGGSASSPTIASLLPGTHVITAVYSGDSNFNASSGSVSPAVTCTTTLTSNVRGGLTVPAGSSACSSSNAITVNGDITVQPGGALYLDNSTLHGGITASGATEVALCGSVVDGVVSASGSNGFVLLGDGGENGCAGNRLHGGSALTGNTAGFEESGNNIRGSITVVGNTVATGARTEDGGLASDIVEGNTLTGTLACSGDTPAAVDEGTSNSAGGGRSGECSALGF